MPSSRRLVLAHEAELDLADIWQYTAETWGEEQAEIYVGFIRSTLYDLTLVPFIGPSRDEIAPGLRIRQVDQHVAYYRVADDAVIVRRIVHSRRDLRSEELEGS